MSYIQINNNYLIGAVNLFVVTILAGVIGVLLILQVKAYELNVSYTFSWRFFFYDPFASRLIILCLLSMIINTFSAVVNMSGLFSRPIETNAVTFSMTSILWIVMYLASDYAFIMPAITPLVLLLIILILLLSQQLYRLRIKIILYVMTMGVILFPVIGRLTDDAVTQDTPQRLTQ